MNNIVFTHSTIKSPAKLKAAQAHNRREADCPNTAPEKTPFNKVLIGEENANYNKVINERYSGITIVKNGVLAHDFIIGVDSLEPVINPLFCVSEFCSKSVDYHYSIRLGSANAFKRFGLVGRQRTRNVYTSRSMIGKRTDGHIVTFLN